MVKCDDTFSETDDEIIYNGDVVPDDGLLSDDDG